MKYYWVNNKTAFNNQNRILKTLKVLFSFLFITLISLNANTYSQNKISLSFENVSIKDVFSEIENKSDYIFLFSGNIDSEMNEKVNITALSETIEKVLDSVIKDTDLKYSVLEKQIIVYKEGSKEESAKNTPVLVAQQQKKKIAVSGILEDKTGEPIAGVTIRVKGTMRGTTSKPDGSFYITLDPETENTLQISCVSFRSKEVVVTKDEHLHLVLEDDVNVMEALVVTGIFTRKSDSYTGAVKTIKAEELANVGNTNILQVLKDIDPAFQVIESGQFGSDPNRMPEIQMRGASSFSDMKNKYQTNPNQPLFIVDGFEQSINKVMDMDMNRVESVTLLKDATAKALYGSKGANGVVVVETKKPEIGKIKVNYTGSLNIQAPDLTSYNLSNAREKLEIERLAGVYTSSTNNPLTQQQLDEEYYLLKKEVERGVDTYWLNKPLRVGIGNKHALNLEGGDEFIRYSLDVNYNDVKGVMKGSDRQTIGGGFMFSYRYKNLLFREHLSVTHNKAENSPYGDFSEYARLNPYWQSHNDDGTVKEIIGHYNIANLQGSHPIYNPLLNAKLNSTNNSLYTDITNNFYIEWNITDALKATGRVGFTYRSNESDVFYPRDHTMFRKENMTDEEYFKRGQYTKQNGKMSNLVTDVGLNYSKVFDKHVLFTNALWSVGQYSTESVSFQAEGFANNKLDYITHAQRYMEGGKPFGDESLSRDVSGLLSTNYSYDNRYLVDANYRANASSLFGANNRWGHFWSFGLGWNLHNESFMKNITWLQQLKLRGSTGYTGSQNFNSYQAISTYRYYGNEVYDNIIGSYLLGLPNPDLLWQKTQDNNIGLNISFLNRVDLTLDYYVKNTSNLLTPVSIPPSVGFASYTENLGKSQNRGVEGQVNVRVIKMQEQDFFFNVFASMNHNTNKIKEINTALRSINDEKDGEKEPNYDHETGKALTTKPSVRYAEGASMSAIWAVRSLGIDPGTGNELFLTKDGDITYTWNAQDQVICGDALPKYTGTFGFNMDWKGFTINTSFYYRLKGQMYNQTLVDKVEDADIQYNVDKRVYTGRWTEPGQHAQFKKLTQPNYFTRPTSRFVQNLNELQMTSLNIGYDFRNQSFLKKGNIERLKLSFYMNDLFRVSSIKTERGTDYPFARMFSFQVQATF